MMRSARVHPRNLGKIMSEEDDSGHTLMCRLIKLICHYSPGGTFVKCGCHDLESGGSLCIFGVECGKPTASYIRQMHERSEQFQHMMRMVEALGIIHTDVWDNPRFSVANNCTCGKSDNRRLPDHDPICGYRISHHFPVTIEEYKALMGQRIQ